MPDLDTQRRREIAASVVAQPYHHIRTCGGNMRLSLLVAVFFVAFIPRSTLASVPNCSGTNSWPSGMAYAHLKNAGILESETTDFTKTRVKRLASEKIGKVIYRQIHEIRFVKKAGDEVTVVAVSDASHEECSMGGVKVYVVSQQLGDLK